MHIISQENENSFKMESGKKIDKILKVDQSCNTVGILSPAVF